MKVPERTFTTVHAEPGPRPLWIGLFSPSGGGKTFSALRLATGIQSVIGGSIELIDTESGRGKHYAEMFDYKYTAFNPPHGSLDYQAVIEHAVNVNKSSIVIIDQLSSEHEGDGGLIEYQEEEVQRLTRGDESKEERVKMLAWTKPKMARKQLLRSMVAHGTSVVFILCFRADESSKPVKKNGKTEVIQMGFMPICGKPFIYECTVCALLMPGASGVPTWEPENIGERTMRKLPEQFRDMFGRLEGKPLSEEVGAELAKWSLGGAKTTPPATKQAEKPPLPLAERAETAKGFLAAAKSKASLEKRWANLKALCDELRDPVAGVDPHLYASLKNTYDDCAAKFSTPDLPEAGGERPEVVDANEGDKTALTQLCARLKHKLMTEEGGDEDAVSTRLLSLTEGRCGNFDDLPDFLRDHPKFIPNVSNAADGGVSEASE